MDKLKESTAKLKKDGEKTWNLLNDMSDEVMKITCRQTYPDSLILNSAFSDFEFCLLQTTLYKTEICWLLILFADV